MDLRDYIKVLQKRRWIVALALLACLVGAGVATALSVPVYEARTKLFVGQRQIASNEIAQGYQLSQLSQQLLKSYAAIIKTRPIAERAVEKDNLPLSPTALQGGLRADPIIDTQLLELSYQSTDAALSQRIVNAVASAFVNEVERIETPRQQNADPAVKVAVVEPALRPGSPVRPQPARNMALAFVLGSMLGVGLAFLAEYLDTSIKDREEIERIAGVPVLATIPRIEGFDSDVYIERDFQSAGAESFRKLRTAIQFLGVDHPVQTVLVTSPFAQEGKSTTALNLSTAFAQAGLRTILVEADLRRPVLHKAFPSDGQRGLTTCLIGRFPLEQAILSTPIRNLSHVPAGAVPPNPTELLVSDHMREILEKLQERADVVILDAPPILPVADASALCPRTDGVLLVVRAGKTPRDRLKEASELVGKVGGRLFGVVLNYLRPQDSQYGSYYYGYSYRSDEGEPDRAGGRLDLPGQQAPTGSGTN